MYLSSSNSLVTDLSRRALGSLPSYGRCFAPLTSFLFTGFECHNEHDMFCVPSTDTYAVPPTALDFCRQPGLFNLCVVVDDDGGVFIMDTNKPAKDSVLATWQGHTNAAFDVAWIPGSEKLLTASGDRTIRLHNSVTKQIEIVFEGHLKSVRSLSCHPTNPSLFTSSSRDGTLRIWDCRASKKCKLVLDDCHTAVAVSSKGTPKRFRSRPSLRSRGTTEPSLGSFSNAQSVTSVVFKSDVSLLSCGASEDQIKEWDVRRFSARKKTQPVNTMVYRGCAHTNKTYGFSHLCLDRANSRLFAYCMDSVLYQYDMLSADPKPVMLYKGHRASSFYNRSSVSYDGQFVACGSGDKQAYIYTVDLVDQCPILLDDYQNEVSLVSWSPDSLNKLVTLSDDGLVKFWRLWRRHQRLLPPDEYYRSYAKRSSMSHFGFGSRSLFSPMKSPSSKMASRQLHSARQKQMNIESFLSISSNATKSEAFSKHKSPVHDRRNLTVNLGDNSKCRVNLSCQLASPSNSWERKNSLRSGHHADKTPPSSVRVKNPGTGDSGFRTPVAKKSRLENSTRSTPLRDRTNCTPTAGARAKNRLSNTAPISRKRTRSSSSISEAAEPSAKRSRRHQSKTPQPRSSARLRNTLDSDSCRSQLITRFFKLFETPEKT